MREGVIFEVTKDHLQNGLRNIPVGYSSTSYCDPEKGIFYLGKSLFELVLKDPLEVIFLLFHGREGSEAEIRVFAREIENHAQLSPEFISEMAKFSKKLDPLTALSMALQLLGALEAKKNLRDDCINLIAKLPLIVAYLISWCEGNENIPQTSDCGFVEMMPLSFKQKEKFGALFPYLQILFYDDEGGAVDFFTGKVVSSAKADLYKSLSAAMMAFSGDLCAQACLKSLDLIQEIEEKTQGVLPIEDVEKILRAKLEKKELLYGFGHPSLWVEDSRATLLYNFARNHYSDDPLIKIALLLRYEAPRIISEFFPHISNPFANIYAILGPLLHATGFVKSAYYPLLLAQARAVGVMIQIFHESMAKSSLVHPHYFYRLR